MGHLSIHPPGTFPELENLVSRIVETRSAVAALQASEAAILAEAGDLVIARTHERRASGRAVSSDLPLREVTSELGAAMRLSDRTVQERMSSASTLTMSFPATFAAFQAGSIDAAHVAGIIDAGAVIADPEARAQYENLLLEAAQFETPHRLRAIARVVAARIDPEIVEALQRRARAGRRVRLLDLDDGMARLLIDLPATLAYAIHDRLTEMAHDVKAAEVAEAAGAEVKAVEAAAAEERADAAPADAASKGAGEHEVVVVTSPGPASDARSMDQLRADILSDLLLTAAPTAHGDADALGAIRAHVQITIPVLTAAGVSNEPALLAGYGPIDCETARRLAADAPGWDRVMFHPHSGAPLAVDRYDPGAALRRFLGSRDERCRFMGCTQRPWRCDVDHTVDAAKGGKTCECNLANLCQRHHTVKHATDWQVRQLGSGVLEWTSLTGRRYLDKPPALVQFVPSSRFTALVKPIAPDSPPF